MRRRWIGEFMLSIVCLAAVIGTLVFIDPRVADRLRMLFGTASSSTPKLAGEQAVSLLNVLWEAVRTQSIAHAPLLIFITAGAFLLFRMLRS